MALYAIIWKKLSNHGHVSKTQCGTKIMYKILTKLTNTEDKKRLLENFLSLSGLQVFTYILPLITLPYLVRVLGVEKYGLVMFAQSFINFFNILVDYGFNLSATREIAVNRDDKKIITEIYSSVMTIKILLLLLSFFVLVVIVFSVKKFQPDSVLFLLTFSLVVGQAIYPAWYFQGMEKMKYITIINILSRIVFTIAIFVFVRTETNYIFVPVLNGLGSCIGSAYAFYIIHKKMDQKFQFQKISILIKHFKDSTQFFLSRVAVSLYSSANTFVLGLLTNNTLVGYYSIAEKLYTAIQSLYNPINQTLYPYVAKEKNIKLYKKIFLTVVSINCIGVFLLFWFGNIIFSLIFTQKIGIETIKIFRIFLVANLFGVPSVLFGYPFLGALGHTKFTNNSVIISSFYHIIALISLVIFNILTIYSIAFLFVTTVIVEFSIRFYGVKKYKLWNGK